MNERSVNLKRPRIDSDDSDEESLSGMFPEPVRRASEQQQTNNSLRQNVHHFSVRNDNSKKQQLLNQDDSKNRASLQVLNQRTSPLGRPMTINQHRMGDSPFHLLTDRQNTQGKEITVSRMSEAVKSNMSSCSNSSDEDANKSSNESFTSTKKSGDESTKKLLMRSQVLLFVISYFANMFSLLGLPISFLTSTFYDNTKENNDKPDPQEITLPEIQVLLLATSVMYFILGSTLEYIRGVEKKIIIPIIAAFGLMKISVGIYDIYVDLDIEIIVISNLQLVHFIVIMRLAISMIFITAISKWFSRTYLHLVMGTWFTNEFLAFEITRSLHQYKNELIVTSGVCLILSTVAIYYFYKLDSIDADMIVNEQAINLTSQHTDSFKTYIMLDDFIEHMKTSKIYLDMVSGQSSQNESIQQQKQQAIINYQEKVLKRWKTPSLLQTMRLNGVPQLMLCTCCLFFKYRILNKFVVIINAIHNNHKLGMIGCFLLSSEIIQISFGYLILKWLHGRRYMFLSLLLVMVLCLELTQILYYAIHDEKPDFSDASSYYLVILEGIIVYSLYYMMCLCGPLDLAKIELLKTNFKVAGMLFGVLCGFQCIVQALFLDQFIDRFLDIHFYEFELHFYMVSCLNVVITLLAFFSIFGIVQEEFKELKTFQSAKAAENNNENLMKKSYLMMEAEKKSALTGSKLNLESKVESSDSSDTEDSLEEPVMTKGKRKTEILRGKRIPLEQEELA